MSGGPLSRRRVLAALATVGAAGSISGFGTGAVLSDRERGDNAIAAGALDLTVDFEVLDGPRGPRGSAVHADGSSRVLLPIPALDRGDAGAVLVTLALPPLEGTVNNPAYVWLRSVCPDPTSTLPDHLAVSLWYADCETGARLDGGQLTPSGATLREVAEALLDGVPLDGAGRAGTAPGSQACLADELCLRVEYELDETYVGDQTAALALDFVAVQCRHDDGRASPFPPAAVDACDPPEQRPKLPAISYVEVTFRDADGTRTGKIEDAHAFAPGTYPLAADPAVDLVVLSTFPTAGEAQYVSFALDAPDGDDPDILKVVVKSGSGANVYYAADEGVPCIAGAETKSHTDTEVCIPTTFADPEGDGSRNATDGPVSGPSKSDPVTPPKPSQSTAGGSRP